MQLIDQLDPLRDYITDLRADGGEVALVPTMGALHAGHLELVREAGRQASHVVVSIFVNPRQFGANEDLSRYPRQLERDCHMLESVGTAVVWAPSVDIMYPTGYDTTVSVYGVSDRLCGLARPGHFDGVATVVQKLFQQVLPDIALFGEKDWQQLAVIRRMARDLDMLLPRADAIRAVPTVREEDGLAMSSRNSYLTPEERQQAAVLPASMRIALTRIESGEPIRAVLDELTQALLVGGFVAVDYAELADAELLTPITERGGSRPARLFVAARIGKARLIDNMPLAG